ncbi:MAG: MerR family transcriptional regulator [Nitrospirae bacterium]|nr:MerR family transcriptional regulator [Nitrospirota bacterium]
MHDAQGPDQPASPLQCKLFYKIGEASEITGLETYVLRYWETEFSFLRPRKSRSGQRIYTAEDINLILIIKRMLYDEKYTIDGVRQKLGASSTSIVRHSAEHYEHSSSARKTLMHVKDKLRELLQRLS